VESMFSYETMFSIHGFVQFADRVEVLTFNAMPATWASPKGGDMWNHQYLQAINEITAVHQDPHVWTNDGPDSELYGLEPNYGCCTANHPQGWPKFANNLFFTTQDAGVAVGVYAPAKANLPNNAGTIETITNYPYDDVVNVILTANKNMPLYLRVPIWATGATISLNGATPSKVANGTMFRVNATTGTTKLEIKFNPTVIMQKGWNGAYSVHYGPLMFSLPIEGVFDVLNYYAFESRDYAVNPASAWQFALQADPANPAASLSFKQVGYVDGDAPFNASGPWPVYISATLRSLPSWGTNKGSASSPPNSPACVTTTCGPPQTVHLVPYGATSLRISEFPLAGTNFPAVENTGNVQRANSMKKMWSQLNGETCRNEKLTEKPTGYPH